ncbi:hypothetical protein GGI15_004791 [Coemansia interrupta]|uniref:Uncharacterized protein n=1 Tax=Coemansia interrupta TaxID=1126814 RepID=A0A9W8H5I1_9FUNG|nr:hypothetical protein GGI15_004791 [Coemansia interrupta]
MEFAIEIHHVDSDYSKTTTLNDFIKQADDAIGKDKYMGYFYDTNGILFTRDENKPLTLGDVGIDNARVLKFK